MYKNVIFREYDIRGVYNEEFDKDFAYLLGKAYVQYFKETQGKIPTITVGHDARLSAKEIKDSLCRGVLESGGNIYYIGLVTSPISYFTTFEMNDVDGAIMITGSHNPPNYNGFKVSVGKQTIFGQEIQRIREIIEKNEYQKGQGVEKAYDIFPEYIKKYTQEFKVLDGVKVIIDCGNGAAGCVVRKLFNALKVDATFLFEEPDGRFPNHHPDPTVEKNLKDLQINVKKQNAVVGIGFDGDADRIGLVDHTGRMVYGDELIMLIARDIVKKNHGAKIIGDVKCSDKLFADIKKCGGEPIMWKSGHSLVKEKIKTEKAPFGGEMSGHIFFADRNHGYDDAIYAALRVIEILRETKQSISELLSDVPESFNTPEIRIDTTEEKKILIVEKLIQEFTPKPDSDFAVNLIDGVRLSFKEGWALARASNTQPVLVMRFESTTKQGLKNIQSRIEKIVNQYL